MADLMWLAWFSMAMVLFVGEMMTVGFFLFWFGLGALAAAIVAGLGGGIAYQWITFGLVSTLGVLFSRKFSLLINRSSKDMELHINANIGKTGVVLEDIIPDENKGIVRVGSEEWRAISNDGSLFQQGQKIKVLKIEGTKLIVKDVVPKHKPLNGEDDKK